MAWAKQHDKCVKCGTTETRHLGRGLCADCYQLDIELRHKNPKPRFRRRIKFSIQSLDHLAQEYSEGGLSLLDLAKKYHCTRQYIYKLLKEHGTPRRGHRAARTLALKKGKLFFTRIDETGAESKVNLPVITIKENFFRIWSREMAYVLGVIYTDGSLSPGRGRDPSYKSPGARLSIAQKEPELLEKVLALMECNATIFRGKQALTGNPIHHFQICNEELYDDLLKLGLTPKKSRTIKFPSVPEPYVRHFIRGCWDGDGSVYLERDQHPRASYVTGSRQFAEEMIRHLVLLGLPSVTLHASRTSNSFYFRFGTVAACTKLYHVFYDEVPATMYLTRKFERFKAIAVNWEGLLADEVMIPPSQRIEPTASISAKYADWRSEYAVQNTTRKVATPERLRTARLKPILAFPEPFTRNGLAELLAISPQEVGQIMQSRPIVANLYKLSRLRDISSQEFTDGVRELRNKVNTLLYGPIKLSREAPEEMRVNPKFERSKNISLASTDYRVHIEKDSHDKIPDRLNRETLAGLLKITPDQVRSLMQSQQIPSEMGNLRKVLKSGNEKEIRAAIQALKSHVHEYLYGWRNEGWNDLD